MSLSRERSWSIDEVESVLRAGVRLALRNEYLVELRKRREVGVPFPCGACRDRKCGKREDPEQYADCPVFVEKLSRHGGPPKSVSVRLDVDALLRRGGKIAEDIVNLASGAEGRNLNVAGLTPSALLSLAKELPHDRLNDAADAVLRMKTSEDDVWGRCGLMHHVTDDQEPLPDLLSHVVQPVRRDGDLLTVKVNTFYPPAVVLAVVCWWFDLDPKVLNLSGGERDAVPLGDAETVVGPAIAFEMDVRRPSLELPALHWLLKELERRKITDPISALALKAWPAAEAAMTDSMTTGVTLDGVRQKHWKKADGYYKEVLGVGKKAAWGRAQQGHAVSNPFRNTTHTARREDYHIGTPLYKDRLDRYWGRDRINKPPRPPSADNNDLLIEIANYSDEALQKLMDGLDKVSSEEHEGHAGLKEIVDAVLAGRNPKGGPIIG